MTHLGEYGAIFVTQKVLDVEECNFFWLIVLTFINLSEISKLTKAAHIGDRGAIYVTQGLLVVGKWNFL